MNMPLSIPNFETLPNSEEVVQISQWLNDAGLSSLELSNAHGTRLRISVGDYEPSTTPPAAFVSPSALPHPEKAPSTDIPVKAPYFGNVLLCNPVTKKEFAPEGSSVQAEDTVAMLQIGELMVPITAPQNGTVAQFIAKEGDLIGYGQTVLTLQPA
ncbi:MAG: biotin/lipoyl-containing protein [Acetobacter malorum]